MTSRPSDSDDAPMRADAQRNRRRLLDAAVAVTLELGGEPTMDAVARRAGVGIGTLYRHFPDRQALLRTMVVDVLDRTIEHAENALAEAPTGGEALRRYLHAAVDTGLGVVNLVYSILDDTDWPDQRAAAQDLLGQLVEAGRRDGALSAAIDAGDVALAAIRFCRPLAIGLDPADERAIAHRQLDTYLDGLASGADGHRTQP